MSSKGVLSGLFGSGAATAPAKTSEKENLSSKLDVTELSPEAIVTSPNFVQVDGLLQGIVEVTPAMAEEWLTRSKNVRNLMRATVLLYAESMSKGQWDKNGQTISFDADGNMIDGQHRCAACVESGKSFVTSVTYGVESSTNIDRNKPRTPDQIIKALGISHDSRTMSGMISFLHAYADDGSKGFVAVGHGKHPLTMDDRIEAAIANSSSLNHSISVTEKTSRIFNKHSLHAALHTIFGQTAGEALADAFYEKLISGVGLTSTDPIYHLRERLLKERTSGKQPQINPYAGLIIKGWNYWISNTPISRLTYRFDTEGIAKIKRSPISK